MEKQQDLQYADKDLKLTASASQLPNIAKSGPSRAISAGSYCEDRPSRVPQ